ncbi:pyridoxamine 5'-phosphate oxidase family protein [Streptomyces sp. ODS28]|uniref:pyridoxamine 5'-phosphate oxidase family protein n=1 Tax=Streptomyces sp. ODS28 TaxID=3136688 RepID=UPI0031ED8960
MTSDAPQPELDPRYSEEGAAPPSWKEARDELASAGTYWLSTVRADGRPHVTPLLGVWLDDPLALYFCTGEEEQKHRNLAAAPHCALTTGHNRYAEGLDVVVEGEAVRVTDPVLLRRLAGEWEAKYGPDWRYTVRDGAFRYGDGDGDGGDGGGVAHVFAVRPRKALGFSKFPFAQTRWRFRGGSSVRTR